jgi:alpha-mannosidase
MDSLRLVAVLPCYSLDDLSKNLDEAVCREFHAAWTALWHPSILAISTFLPEWKRSDGSSLDLENALVVGPASTMQTVDIPLRERLVLQGCTIVDANEDRQSTLLAIAEDLKLDLSAVPSELTLPRPEGDAEVLDLWGQVRRSVRLADFHSLGFAMLLVQHMTRKIHYSSNLDLVIMADQAKSAASAYLAGDANEAERWLQSCFDQLSQERDRYFNQSAYLIDLTLLAESTLGTTLDEQLQQSQPQNMLADAGLVRRWIESNPNGWAQFAQRLAKQQSSIVGGLDRERIHAWHPLGTLQRDLDRGRKAYEEMSVVPPRVFARYGAGMTLDYPTHLKALGYIGVLLYAFSDGHYPISTQAKISWEASDTTQIDAINGSIFDASSCRAFFHAVGELAKQFDHHQVPTLVATHWPDRVADAFFDVLEASRRTNAFGEWTTFEKYFESTGYVYSLQNFSAKDFRFNLPKSDREFFERSMSLHRQLLRNTRLESTRCLGLVVARTLEGMKNRTRELERVLQQLNELEELLRTSDDLANNPPENVPRPRQVDESKAVESPAFHTHESILTRVRELRDGFAKLLGSVLPRRKDSPTDKLRYLVINPYSGPQRLHLRDLEGCFHRTEENRIYEAYALHGKSEVIVDVPPLGVVQLEGVRSEGLAGLVKGRKAGPNLASPGWLLANEFLECQIDPEKGYLRSVMIARKRGGRLSGMPAVVAVDASGRSSPIYSTIRNAKNRIEENDPMHAYVSSTGELFIDERKVAGFELTFSLWRGSRSLDIGLRMNLIDSQKSNENLWLGSPVWRTAWPSQASDVAAWLQGTKSKMKSVQFFAPELIEIDDAEHRIYLGFQGLPLHRRIESSFLDTLLPFDDDGNVEQNWSIGVDWPRPYQNYLETLDEPCFISDEKGSLQTPSGLWFAQTNQPNVRIAFIGISPSCGVGNSGGSEVRQSRSRLLIHETNGREVRTKLSFFRDAVSAARVDVMGASIEDLVVENGQVIVDVKPNEIGYIEIAWNGA